MSEWVPESDWANAKEDQNVRLSNADGAVEFIITSKHQIGDSWLLRSGISDYPEWSWNLFVEAPDPESLPTEPGYYQDSEGDLWAVSPSGVLFCVSESVALDAVLGFAPFTRLATESETARKVLNAIKEYYGEDYIDNVDSNWNKVAVEFGVTW